MRGISLLCQILQGYPSLLDLCQYIHGMAKKYPLDRVVHYLGYGEIYFLTPKDTSSCLLTCFGYKTGHAAWLWQCRLGLISTFISNQKEFQELIGCHVVNYTILHHYTNSLPLPSKKRKRITWRTLKDKTCSLNWGWKWTFNQCSHHCKSLRAQSHPAFKHRCGHACRECVAFCHEVLFNIKECLFSSELHCSCNIGLGPKWNQHHVEAFTEISSSGCLLVCSFFCFPFPFLVWEQNQREKIFCCLHLCWKSIIYSLILILLFVTDKYHCHWQQKCNPEIL